MSDRRTKYVVAMCGDLNRGERMNCAVLAWDDTLGVDAPVTVHIIKDWTRIHLAFFSHLPPSGSESWRENIIERISGIKILGDFRRVIEKSGPYTPFEFTEERGSTVLPEETAADMAEYFLRQKV